MIFSITLSALSPCETEAQLRRIRPLSSVHVRVLLEIDVRSENNDENSSVPALGVC